MNQHSKPPNNEPEWLEAARRIAAGVAPGVVWGAEMMYQDEWVKTGCSKLGFTMLVIAALHAHMVKAAGEAAEKDPIEAMMQGLKTYIMMHGYQCDIDYETLGVRH